MSTQKSVIGPRPTIASLTRANAALRRELAALRHDHAELLAAARASVSALYDGQALPLTVLIDALDQLGHLPEYGPEVTAEGLVALADGEPLTGRRVA